MRGIGLLHPTDDIPIPPDTVGALVLAAGTASTLDVPTGATHVRLSGQSTGNSPLQFFVNFQSTAAVVPSASFGATTGTSSLSQGVNGSILQRLLGGVTAMGVVAQTSGIVTAEWWKIGG